MIRACKTALIISLPGNLSVVTEFSGPDSSLDKNFAGGLVQPNRGAYEIMASGVNGALKGLE